MEPIKFYRVNEEYGYFSNFAPYPIFIDSIVWPTSEHFFQASKFLDSSLRERIRTIGSPLEAAEEGRKRTYPLRNDWEEVKDYIMKRAVERKFLQHHDIKKRLLETGERMIIEHTLNDRYWGDGGDGRGKNMLGIILMKFREDLRNLCPFVDWVLPPWIAFPEVDQLDMFWRMGIGENYMYTWAKWYNNQIPAIKLQYQQNFPPTELWDGFYT